MHPYATLPAGHEQAVIGQEGQHGRIGSVGETPVLEAARDAGRCYGLRPRLGLLLACSSIKDKVGSGAFAYLADSSISSSASTRPTGRIRATGSRRFLTKRKPLFGIPHSGLEQPGQDIYTKLHTILIELPIAGCKNSCAVTLYLLGRRCVHGLIL